MTAPAYRRSDIADGEIGRSLRDDESHTMICPLGVGWLILTDEGEVSTSELAVVLNVRGLPMPDAADLIWVRS